MKITIASGIFPPDSGGPAIYVPKIAEYFSRLGHQVEVICLSNSLKPVEDTYTYPVIRISRKLFLPIRIIKTILAIYISAKKADIIYVNTLGFESYLAGKLVDRPIVHKVVGDYAWERARNKKLFSGSIDDYQSNNKSILLKIFDWVRSTPLLKAKSIIVPSQYLATIVENWGIPKNKIKIIYNAVENKEDKENEDLPEYEGNTLMTVCRLVSWKGVDSLISVMREIENSRLVVVGDGPLLEELRKQTTRMGLTQSVIFLGNVDHSVVHSLLRKANLFILNSTYEGLPHVVLEAMTESVPVIATDVGGTSELVINHKTGILIPPDDQVALKNAIYLILNDQKLSGLMVKTAHDLLANEFSMEKMTSETELTLMQAVK